MTRSGDVVKHQKDHGWAWMIAAAGTVNLALSMGIYRSLGILMVELMTVFDIQTTHTSMLLSSFGTSFTLSALLLNTALGGVFHERALVVIGASVGCLGCVLPFIEPSVEVIVFGSGLCLGINTQTVVTSSTSIVARYFEKRLVLASSAMMCGAGIGVLVLSLLSRYLLDEYTYRGASLILGGLALNGFVCAALMRPFPGTALPACRAVDEMPKTSPRDSEAPTNASTSHNRFKHSHHSSLIDKTKTDQHCDHTQNKNCQQSFEAFASSPEDQTVLDNSQQEALLPADPRLYNKKDSLLKLNHGEDSNLPPEKTFHAEERIHKQSIDLLEDNTGVCPSGHQQRLDKVKVGFISRFVFMKQTDKGSSRSCRDIFAVDMFRNPTFILLQLFTLFFSVSSEFAVQFYPAITHDMGFTANQSAILLSIIGFTGLLGRLLAGFLGDYVKARYKIVLWVQSVLGVAVLLCQFAVTFWSQVLYAVTVGLTYGIPFAYKTALIRDFFDGADPSKMIAMNLVMNGLGLIAGTPLTGWMRDKTGSYVVPIYFMAGLIALNVPILLSMVYLKRRRTLGIV